MSDCLFCKIVAGQIPSNRVLEDEHLIAFRDIQPAAPVHVLVVPRKHLTSLAELTDADLDLAGRLLTATAEVARREGIDGTGYRVVANTGRHGCQSVDHLHLHVMGGRQLSGHGTA
jgi:histidine triad (HIT) family protein